MKLSKEKAELLTGNILSQAKYYLDEADEFYPFGAVINQDSSIGPISIYWGEEYPAASEVATKLEEAIKNGIQKGVYDSGAMGMGVYVKSEAHADIMEKKPAVQVIVYSNGSYETSFYVYSKNEGGYFFERHNLD